MKTNKFYSGLIAVLLMVISTTGYSQARVQVIHNSADAAAAVVDVWLNDTKLIENFAFRTATPFIDAPADVEFTIAIQGPGSTSPENPIWSQNYTLAAGKTYILVAEGIVSPSGYNPSIPFDIAVYDMGREEGIYEYFVDVLIHHGATDAPTVDIYDTWQTNPIQLVNNISYSEFADYLSIINGYYLLEVRDESGTNTLATFEASLGSFLSSGDAATIIASGFLNPANNSNGPAFGLWVALAEGGDLIELPSIGNTSIARVQVIHNSADVAAAVVDVWLNDTKLIENFAFRTATPFIDAPADVEFTIAIQGPGSISPENPIWSQQYTLEAGETYILVANGIVSASGYEPSQPFDIYVYDMGREMATMEGNTDVLVFHGSTDAPIVDVVEVGVGAGTIVDDLGYSEFAGYLELPTADYALQIRDQSGTTTVAEFAAPLATLGLENAALAVLASGFLNPAENNDGPAFGLWVALPSGGALIPLPSVPISTARVQVIHNSADAAAEFVDVWLNDILLIDDFQFRTASPFIDAPAGVDFDVTIQPANSTDTTNGLARFTYNLAGGSKYILVANGIVVPDGYNPPTPFDIYVYDMGREMAMMEGNTDVLVFHGSTDAPVVDVVEVGVGAGTIVDNLAYADFAGYLELPTDDYYLEIRDESGTVTVASYSAPLATFGLEGQALAIIASGFLNPANNNNGPAFALFVALPSGGELIELGPTTSVTENIPGEFMTSVFPNPARDIMNVQFELPAPADVQLQIFSMTGALMKSQQFSANQSGSQIKVNINDLPNGLYIVKMQSGSTRSVTKLNKVN